MKRDSIKIGLLSILILTSIIQTAMLWLGDMQGHNFLESKPSKTIPIAPENIFRNKGDPFTVSYRISENTREYQRFVGELQNMLSRYGKDAKNIEIKPLDWESILAMQGMLYEYIIPVSLDELAGVKVGLDEIGFINAVFLTLDDNMGSKVRLYLVSEKEKLSYKLEITGEFTNLAKLYNGFNIENVGDLTLRYQPSKKAANISRYIEGNVFMPLTSEVVPLEYDVLKFINPVDVYDENKQIILDKYTSELFDKPILKEVEYRDDGSIVFTESMKSMVMYRPLGTIEYVNLETKRTERPMTMLEGYNVAVDFIQNAHIMSEETRGKLYLTDITQKGKEYTFYFDLRHKGYSIILSPEVKAAMGIDHILEITIKDHQIISGKWSIRELKTFETYGVQFRNKLTTGYADPINKMYAGLQVDVKMPLLEEVAPVYEIEALERPIEMKWGVFSDGVWYYP